MRSALLFAFLALIPAADERQRVAARDLQRLQNPDRVVALIAAHGLGRAGAVEAIPALWKLWRSDDRDGQYAALNALAAPGDERAVGWILRELRSDDPLTRCKTIQRLGAVGRSDLAVHLEPMFGDERLPADGRPCEVYFPIGWEARRVYAALTTRSLSSAP